MTRQSGRADSLNNPGNQLDLGRNTKRKRRQTDGRTRMPAPLTEHVDEEIRTSVDHCGHLVEGAADVHHSEHLDDLIDAIERPEIRAHRREYRQRGDTRRVATLFECEVPTLPTIVLLPSIGPWPPTNSKSPVCELEV